MLSTLAFAKDDDTKLQSEFGQDLTHAPFFLRYSFFKHFNKDWKESKYEERRSFLADYEEKVLVEQNKEQEEVNAEALKKKENERQNQEALRQENNKLKAEQQQEKDAQDSETQRQKEFNTDLNEQQKQMEQLQKELEQSRLEAQLNNR